MKCVVIADAMRNRAFQDPYKDTALDDYRVGARGDRLRVAQLGIPVFMDTSVASQQYNCKNFITSRAIPLRQTGKQYRQFSSIM